MLTYKDKPLYFDDCFFFSNGNHIVINNGKGNVFSVHQDLVKWVAIDYKK